MTTETDFGVPVLHSPLDRRTLLRRAAAVGFTVPTLSALTALTAAAADNIKFVAMNYDDTMQEDTEKLVDAFNDSQGDVKADVQVVSWNDGYQTLVTMISGNKAPDLANVSASWMIEFNGIQALEP